jgi:hypothetical protein
MATPKRHRSFGKKTTKKLEPITFDVFDETFEAHPKLPGIVILEYVAAVAGSDEDSGAEAAIMILDFFEKALVPESFERFDKLAHDPEVMLDTEELTEIVGWLMEQYTDRPTEAS